MERKRRTYEQVLARVNGKLRFGMKPGLARIQALLDGLGNPERKLRVIHVAGTNGKGSCCALLSAALQEAGCKTGMYTSPYVLDFRERFQIDGEMISEDEVVQMAGQVQQVAEAIEAQGETVTEFEYITAMALLWFSERRCDYVVLEVGLGGRFDATNVVPVPEVAVIMSISLDHTAILGDDVAQIAFEKAGIIKAGGRVVLYPQQEPEALAVLTAACKERGADCVVPDKEAVVPCTADLSGTRFFYRGTELKTPFAGAHQVLNACTAFEVMQLLRAGGLSITDEAICKGFAKARMPARMELIRQSPLVLLDGGHNPGCAAALRDTLEAMVMGKSPADGGDPRPVAVMGMMADKDVGETLRILAPCFQKIITVAPDQPRAMDALALAAVANKYGPAMAAGSMEEAVELAAQAAKEGLVVTGSLFLASEIRPLLYERFGK